MEFLVKQKKNGKQFVLENGEIRVVLSRPVIQPYNEYVYTSPKDILYFYYNLALYENERHFEKRLQEDKAKKVRAKWRKITESFVGDFGALLDLQEFVDRAVKFNILTNGRKEYLMELDFETNQFVRSKTDFDCRETFELSGYLNEDVYKITKIGRYFESSHNIETGSYGPQYTEYYKMFFGCGNLQTKENVIGVSMTLDEADLLLIKKWAEEFITYAGELTKQRIEARYDIDDDSPYCPHFLKEHLAEKYPEDLPKLKKIYEKLYEDEDIIEEYYNFCTGKPIEEAIAVKLGYEFITAQYFLDKGQKDYEAYISLLCLKHPIK